VAPPLVDERHATSCSRVQSVHRAQASPSRLGSTQNPSMQVRPAAHWDGSMHEPPLGTGSVQSQWEIPPQVPSDRNRSAHMSAHTSPASQERPVGSQDPPAELFALHWPHQGFTPPAHRPDSHWWSKVQLEPFASEPCQPHSLAALGPTASHVCAEIALAHAARRSGVAALPRLVISASQ
jgi:hypothetical protein